MRIGIAAPIEVTSLKQHLSGLSAFDLSLGLGGTAVNIIIDGLLKQGHQVTIFTLDPKVKKKYIIEGNNLKIIFGNFRSAARIKTFDFCYKEFTQIKNFIQDESKFIDIVNAHWSYEFAIGALLAMPNKTIVTFRDDAPSILKILKQVYRITRLFMDFWVRKKTKYIIYNSPYLARLIGLQGDIIGNPIFDENITAPRVISEGKTLFKICFISNGTDVRKNPHIAVKAFSRLKEKYDNVELYFIGKGYASDDEFAKKYNKIKGLFFIGFLKHEDLLSKLKEYDIMLHTALEESFGNNLIEAMAKGMPVVAGENSGAVPWVLNKGKAGILVDITNADLIAEALEKLIVNQNTYNQFSRIGYQNVVDRFSQTSVCQKYIEVYKKAL